MCSCTCPAGSRRASPKTVRSTGRSARRRAAVPIDKRPPNIVLIVADDLGYNDISFNGGGVAGGLLKTPNIDALGRDGVTFADGYAGNATCAPSRAALMTGRYPTRFGYEFTPAETRPPAWFPVRPDPHRRGLRAQHRQLQDRVGTQDDLRRGRRPQPATTADKGMPGERDHHRRTAPRPRLSHRPPRQMAPRRGQGDAARGAGLRREPGLHDRRPDVLARRQPRRGEFEAGFRPDRPVPVGQPAVQRAV